MEIIVFILLAGVWAAFLLPSFFDSRRAAPRASTQAFARSKALLANVSTGTGRVAPVVTAGVGAREVQARRRRTFVVLGGAVVTTLVMAVVTGSLLWLGVTILADVAFASYVTLLLTVKQRRAAGGRTVVYLPGTSPVAVAEPEPDVEAAPPTVRVIAG